MHWRWKKAFGMKIRKEGEKSHVFFVPPSACPPLKNNNLTQKHENKSKETYLQCVSWHRIIQLTPTTASLLPSIITVLLLPGEHVLENEHGPVLYSIRNLGLILAMSQASYGNENWSSYKMKRLFCFFFFLPSFPTTPNLQLSMQAQADRYSESEHGLKITGSGCSPHANNNSIHLPQAF